MVLPILGLLAATAGTAYLGQRYAMPRIREAERRTRADQMQGLLSGLPEDASPDETVRAMAEQGLLSAEQFAQFGFGDRKAERDFGYDMALQQEQQRAQFGQLAQAGAAAYQEGRQKIVDTFQPQLDTLNRQYEGLTNIIGIAKEAKAMSPLDYNRWIGSPEGRAVTAQLEELETQGFYDFKRQVYGDAEPPAHVLEDLQNRYRQFTQGGITQLMTDGRWDLIGEIYDRRLQDVERRAKGVERDYYRNLDAYDQNNLMIPGALGGGSVEGDVSMSSRNMPPLIQQESGGNWGATNDEGMVGRAQFSPERLDEVREGLGLNFSTQEFLRNPRLQKAAEAWHFDDIEDYIQDNGLDEYIGKRLGGTPITLQGMLNVAHLGGKHGLSRFLASAGRYDPKDSNGVHLSDYLRLGARG